ncbi:MAG: SH3 domain-containing protein [Candidatus Omnitrophica bacterium]|nr:SH3 domain-containing protein [Candidatus Omnitrophota bacterium]
MRQPRIFLLLFACLFFCCNPVFAAKKETPPASVKDAEAPEDEETEAAPQDEEGAEVPSEDAEEAEPAPPAPVPVLFQGQITSDKINVRTDSSVSSQVICVLNKDQKVEVIKAIYEWYKIRLPQSAPSYIRKDMARPIDGKTAKIAKENVNVRLGPGENYAVLGKAQKNEVVNILEDAVSWYKIEPTANSFAWVHKKFVEKVRLPKKEKPEPGSIVVEGTIKPYAKKRVATHRLISTSDKKTYLLIGKEDSLKSLSGQKVKVTGKKVQPERKKNPLIEVLKIEALD